MKRERAFVENRRKQILDKIIDSPGIHVEELADLFRVSAITIRRDLQYLEDQKKLTRYYGGAVANERSTQDDVALYRDQIARYAATLVEDGDTVFINTSRTALQILQYIRKKNVTVITNNGRALSCDHPDGVNVILTGGELRYPKEAMVGEFAERNLLKCYAKLAFVGCSGISEESGVTTDNANEVNLNELMLRRATKCAYILADHTKIGSMSSFRTCSIERVTNLVTDERAPKEVLDIFREKGIDVHQVSRNDIFE